MARFTRLQVLNRILDEALMPQQQVLGPSPWTRLLPTSLGEVSRDALAAWFEAGACAVGMWRELIPKECVEAGDYAAITRRVQEVWEWVQEASRNRNEMKGKKT